VDVEKGEERLAGGTVTPVVRVGATVRRATGPWSARVHQLLRHLQAAGFEGAPRFLGVDEQGREALTFIAGEVTTYGPPAGMYTDGALVAAAKLLRRFHEATVDFAPGHLDGWRFQVGAPRAGPVICHNDAGPYNAVYRAGHPIAFIDWDFAAPAPREWDIAYALWRFVPLYDDHTCTRLGWPVAPRGPRIAQATDCPQRAGELRRGRQRGMAAQEQQHERVVPVAGPVTGSWGGADVGTGVAACRAARQR
jgi:hypothetical protein